MDAADSNPAGSEVVAGPSQQGTAGKCSHVGDVKIEKLPLYYGKSANKLHVY